MVRISEGSGSMSEFKRDRKDYHMVGKCVPKKDSNQLLLGKPVFMDDIVPQDCLVVKLLRSPHAHALVEEVKTAAALKVPGIEAIYTWKDVPEERFCIAGQTYPEPSPYDRLILDQRVRCVGDPVAIVAGENEKAVDKALRLIKVKYQVLEPVLDFRKALDNEVLVHPEENWKSYGNTGDVKRNLLHHEEDTHGDVEQILSECADVIQAVCNLASSLGVYDLEPYIQACEQRNRERGRISGDGESRTYSPVEIPKQKTCPRCGSKHVITTKAITIGEGKYSEAETDLCLTCRLNFAGEQ